MKIKPGVKYSAPVDREVTSKDVKYAIERGFFNTVNNGYAGAYFGDIEGAKVGVEPGTKISGIETPDDQTVVLKLSKPTGGIYKTGALSLPLTAPVPEEYARKLDKENPSAYGANQVATGPYMIQNDASGKAIGYEPGRRINLVRNPNWDKSLDYKPAYLDQIDMPQGNDDTTVASRKILSGQNLTNGDFAPDPAILKQAVTRQKEQLQLVPAGGGRYVSMNTTHQAVRRHQRAQGGVRRLQPHGAAAGARRRAGRRHPDARHPAERPRPRGGRRAGGSRARLHEQARRGSRPGGRVLQEGGLRLGQVRGHG